MIRRDLAAMLAGLLAALDRARALGDVARVRWLRGHLATMWAHVGELLTMVCDDCAAWAAGGDAT